MKPTEKQIDFATAISEMVGADLPEDCTAEAYSDFISENENEFYKLRNKQRYSSGQCFEVEHSYVANDEYGMDLNKNPKTV